VTALVLAGGLSFATEVEAASLLLLLLLLLPRLLRLPKTNTSQSLNGGHGTK